MSPFGPDAPRLARPGASVGYGPEPEPQGGVNTGDRTPRTDVVLIAAGVHEADLDNEPDDQKRGDADDDPSAPSSQGIWLYDIPPGSTLPAIANYATVQAYLNVSRGKYDVYSFAVIVVKGGTCTKGGRTDASTLVSGTNAKTLIAVKPDGSFSATRNAVSDEAGSKGTVQLKGVFDGVHLKGTATVHMQYPVFGDCRATGKFASKGVLIG